MRTSALRLAAGVLAAALLLSGCGGSPDPSPLPKTSKSTSPSASAALTPPVMPAGAMAKTDSGVGDFARYYVSVFNHATDTGDVQRLRDLSSPNCQACARIINQIDDVYGAGGSITSDGWLVPRLTVVPDLPISRKYVDLLVVQSPQEVVASTGAEPKTFPGGKQPITMLMAWHANGWSVTDLRMVQ